jgi:hypothetical protein
LASFWLPGVSWEPLVAELGGEMTRGGFFRNTVVRIPVRGWTVVLTCWSWSTPDRPLKTRDRHVHTQLTAPFASPTGFRFAVSRKSFLSNLAKRLGMQDVAVGDPWFDEQFIVKSNDETCVRALFADARLRHLLLDQLELMELPNVCFEVQPPGELHFDVPFYIDDLHRLKQLIELFAQALDQLVRIGGAVPPSPAGSGAPP